MVAVIVPCYNSERYLAQTIESVRRQTWPDWRLILVDDGSTDGTPAICDEACRADGRVRAVHQANAGIASARNRGLSELDADSDAVAFLDHDDVWESDALDTLLGALNSDPGAVGAHGVPRKVGPDGTPSDRGELEAQGRGRFMVSGHRLAPVPESEPTTLAALAFWNCIVTVGQVVIRRAALDRVGGFDPAVVPADDWDLWLRFCRIGHFAYVPRVVVSWRVHGSNTSKAHRAMYQAMRRARAKLLAEPGLSTAERDIVWTGFRLVSRAKLMFAREALAGGHTADAARELRRAAVDYMRYLAAAGSNRLRSSGAHP